MSTVDEAEIKKLWAARGFSCDLWVDPPGRAWNDFVHDTDELVMLVEGEEEFEMNGKNIGYGSVKNFSFPQAPTTPLATSEGPPQNGCTAISENKSSVLLQKQVRLIPPSFTPKAATPPAISCNAP